ncbi:MAG TPA: Na+/H+ antiporter NhaA [Solirubrobacterales bacterium]|nr:Na+/H+ antiporter NhaA [Solirubrobacterales bacterium]
MAEAAPAVDAGRSVGRKRELVAQFAEPLRAFLRTETGGAGLLLAATVAALIWANSPLSDSYAELWETTLGVEIGGFELREDLHFWVNDGLMVFFFFVIGLEIRREFAMGQLTDRSRVAIPVIAAVAGIAVPALVYLGFNPSGEAARGWGVAMATDTAFVLGALALVGPRFSAQLRVFLLTLAIVDDVGALAAIGIFYSEDVSLVALAVVAACTLAIFGLTKLRVWQGPAYFAVGAVLWAALVESGIHPAIGGVLIGALISVYPPRPEEVERAGMLTRAFGQSPLPELARSAKLSLERAVSPNERLQELLHPWTSFVVVPVFALANAGVEIDGDLVARAISSPVTHGVIAGLVVGKLAGIGIATTLAVKLGLGRLPDRLDRGQLWGGAALAGIGFTVSLFVVELAFDSGELQDEARLGVLSASLLATLVGWAIFRADAMLAPDAGLPPMALAAPIDPERDHIRGPVDAPLTLVEYADFECPYCGHVTGLFEELRGRFGDDLRYVLRHLPLADVHPRAELAAEAAEAAGAQGAFWPMHDLLFAHQDELEPADLLGYAAELGLDVEQFTRDLGTGRFAERVRADVASADASGADGTPTFFVNGRRHLGRYDAETLAEVLAAEWSEPSADAETGDARARRAELARPALGLRRAGEGTRSYGPLVLEGLTESPDRDGALPHLGPAQIATLAGYGTKRRVGAGERIFDEGDASRDFVVVLAGLVAMVEGYGTLNRVRTVHGPGRFLGELGVLSGEGIQLTAVAAEPGEVLVVPYPRLRMALAADPELDDLVLRAYLLRRSILLGLSTDIRIVGSAGSDDMRRLETFAVRRGLRHVSIDLDSDERAAAMLDELGVDAAETPVVVTEDGKVLRRPSDDELARGLGLAAGPSGDDQPR